MNQLTIKLTGKVNSSNFDEWKNDLISLIKSINVELVTDDDFVTALKQVNSFKAAEKSLKQAKQSAIDQAEEIQQLFSAIDEITEEARQSRLSLERQIKARKLEIKNQYIQSGIDVVQEFIDKQVEEFKYIDKSDFVSRSRFESVIRGKAGTKGVKNAIDILCVQVKKEVSDKAIEIYNNKAKIEELPTGYKLLFQDWKSLLGLPTNVLELEIDKRIARYNEEILKKELEKQTIELQRIENVELNPMTKETENESKENSQILIDLLSTKDKAKELTREIQACFGNDPSINEIKLVRNHNDQYKKDGVYQTCLSGEIVLSKVARAIIDKFNNQINSEAICLSSSVPKLAPLKDLKISNEVLSFIEKYEPQIVKNGGVYEHQEKILNAISNTQLPNIIMTTSTGSGKSLCFWSWIASELTKNENATAIVSCPTQALLWGQSERLRRISRKDSLITYEISSSGVTEQLAYAGEIEFGNKAIGWTIWYGVQKDENMKELSNLPQFLNARIRIATLDKIHWNLFRDWQSEIFFLKNLKCFVIDEAHVWNGLAGANVRRMIDRLKLSSDVYGLKYPAFFLASATLANPIEFAENLTGIPSKDFLAIDDTGSSKIEILDTDQVPDQLNRKDYKHLRRYVILIRPQPKTISALDLLKDEKSIGKMNILNFVQSKFIGHRRYLELLGVPNRMAVSYDADLPTNERRAIEKDLQDKNLTGTTVIATSAFEVGIDIPSLDMIIMDKLSSSRTELLQRLGRVGRSVNRPGLAVLCLRYSPFDEQLLRQPQETLSVRNAKMLPIPLHLDIVKLKAMFVAFNEWMYRLKNGQAEWDSFNKALQKHFGESPTYQELNEKVNNRLQELIDINQKNWFYKGFRVSASQEKIKLVRKDNNEVIAYIEDIAVFRDAHPEGIYLSHKGQCYRICNYIGDFKLGKWTDPNSDVILGKFFKSLDRIEVEPEMRKIATRGAWSDSFTLYEEREAAVNSDIPKSGKFDYGIWEFIRKFDGYVEIELDNKTKPAKTVSFDEIAERFRKTIENGQDFPFLHNFSYRTLGWRWKIVKILEEEQRDRLKKVLPEILQVYLCDAVECSKNDLNVSFDPKSGDFRVVDTTPGGNGLSEALLFDNRIINGLSNTIASLRAMNQESLEMFFKQQCQIDYEIPLEEVIDAIRKMESAWKR